MKFTQEHRNAEMLMANDAACIWMPHHELALIQYLLFILPHLLPSLSVSLSVCPLILLIYHIFSLFFSSFHHCPALKPHIWLSAESHERKCHIPLQAADHHPGMSMGWLGLGCRDGENGGMNGQRSGGWQERPCSIVCFLKTWRFFDDYSNPTKDLSAWTGCLIAPPQSFSH